MGSNRRHIGHNRLYSGNSMSVNPWQGGVAPTDSGISQFFQNNTQAQLALALTNLLRPPALQSNQPLPSLLNLPQINPGSSYGDYPRHSYNDRYNNRSSNVRRGRFNDNKIQNRPSRDRRRNEHHRKSDGRSNNDNSNKNNKERSLSKTKESESKPDSESKTDNQSEETEDKKRDWKEEKKNGTNQENGDNDETKDGSAETDLDTTTNDENNEENKTNDKNKENNEKSTENVDESKLKDTKSEKTRNKDGRYAGIPVEYLKCLVCEKSMWDGESFEKHLRGRAHQQMCDSLKESYDIQADMMRQAIRLAEERKAIELNRQKRHGKRVEFRKVSHCNMCAFDFYGREAEHRRSPGHQKLKRFLHPRCKRCRVEFPMKIEWEEHRLTPEHIRKIIETKDIADTASVDLDSSDDILDLNLDGDDYEEEDHDPDNVIVDIDDTTDLLTNFDNRIPVYKKNRNVGNSTITEITGHFCKLCNRFFQTEAKAQMHGKSKVHYDNFIKYLKNKNAEKNKQNEKDAKKHALAEDEENVADEDGNWKRRKVSAEDQPADDSVADGDKQEKDLKKDDLYDPMEAEEEDEEEDVEMIENKTVNSVEVDVTSEIVDSKKSEIVQPVEEKTEQQEEVKPVDVIQEEPPATPIQKEEPSPPVDVKTSPVVIPQRPTRNTRANTGGRRPGPLSKTRGRN